jgi:hypothetical protein
VPLAPEGASVGLDIRVVGNDSGEKVGGGCLWHRQQPGGALAAGPAAVQLGPWAAEPARSRRQCRRAGAPSPQPRHATPCHAADLHPGGHAGAAGQGCAQLRQEDVQRLQHLWGPGTLAPCLPSLPAPTERLELCSALGVPILPTPALPAPAPADRPSCHPTALPPAPPLLAPPQSTSRRRQALSAAPAARRSSTARAAPWRSTPAARPRPPAPTTCRWSEWSGRWSCCSAATSRAARGRCAPLGPAPARALPPPPPLPPPCLLPSASCLLPVACHHTPRRRTDQRPGGGAVAGLARPAASCCAAPAAARAGSAPGPCCSLRTRTRTSPPRPAAGAAHPPRRPADHLWLQGL